MAEAEGAEADAGQPHAEEDDEVGPEVEERGTAQDKGALAAPGTCSNRRLRPGNNVGAARRSGRQRRGGSRERRRGENWLACRAGLPHTGTG